MGLTVKVLKPNGRIYTMDIEDYVKGVVPRETPASWHPNALRAQAIAARTYALANRKHRAAGYDVCSTTCCQVYSDARDSRTNAAVDATRGIVGCARGTRTLRSTYFSARCGGHTSNSWGPSWLNSVPCICYPPRFGHGQGYCQTGGHRYASRGYSALWILNHYYNLDWRLDYGNGPIWDGRDVGVYYPPTPPQPEPEPTIPSEPSNPQVPAYLAEDSLFDDAINLIFNLHTLLWQWADAVSGVWLIGSYLESRLDAASRFLRDVCFKLWRFRAVVIRAFTYVNKLIDGTLINDVLERFLWNFSLLRSDPGAWVFAHIRYAWREWDVFLKDPRAWVKTQVIALWPTLDKLLGNFDEQVAAAVERSLGALAALRKDPVAWLRAQLNTLLKVDDAFWKDPWASLRERVLAMLWEFVEANVERVWTTAERVLIKLWE